MKYLIVFNLFIQVNFSSFGQQRPFLVFDIVNGTLDSITGVNFDSQITNDKTDFFTGTATNGIANLDMQTPTMNVFNNTSFTMLSPTIDTYSLDQFPISTSVQLTNIEDGIDIPWCSGSMISSKHVLTAAHCVASLISVVDSITIDSMRVAPVFNNGVSNSTFGTSFVEKIYLIRDWDLDGEDIAILELQEPLGTQTGWLGVGFNQNEAELINQMYYKFSYPHSNSNGFNGDTLYTNFGNITFTNDDFIGINGAIGYVGQSGSSIIHINNEIDYTTYGTARSAAMFIHTNIKNWHYYSILEIIKDYVDVDNHELETNQMAFFPNPTNDLIQLKTNTAMQTIELRSLTGQLIQSYKSTNIIDLTQIQSGGYLLSIHFENGQIMTKKIIKE